YYNKTTQEGLYAHFMAVAEGTELPIIIYNVPSRTNLDISPDTLHRLAASGRFIALKESSYNVPLIMEKVSAMEGKIALYSGNDDQVYPLMALGAQGLISVAANLLPRATSDMVNAYLAGDLSASLAAQLKLMPLVRALFAEVSPIPCKYAMARMGLCSGELRLPLVEASEGVKRQLVSALDALNVPC
ncbi:MAG: dihydrodipicolinate synthase family protein, partial [Clostridia bacterium]